jgi:hypothetical protein
LLTPTANQPIAHGMRPNIRKVHVKIAGMSLDFKTISPNQFQTRLEESAFQTAFGPSQTGLIFLLHVCKNTDSAYECLFLRASHFSTVFNGFYKVPICPTYLIKKSKSKNNYLGLAGLKKK